MGEDGSFFRVRLYRNSLTITPALLYSSIQEATYEGYVEYSSAIWSAPAIDVNGDAFTLSPAIVFQKSLGGVSNTIYGAYLTHEDGVHSSRILQIEAFTSPIVMAANTDQIPLRWLFNTRNIAA